MMKQTADAAVKERLLVHGLRIFAEKGFDGGTVREICQAANSNIAAINYYYGDKNGFYTAILRYAWELRRSVSDKTWELARTDVWAALRHYVNITLDATFDETMFQAQTVFLRELIGSGNHPNLREDDLQFCESSRQVYDTQMHSLICDILGEAATEKNIRLVRFTFYSMCLYLPIQRMVEDSFYQTETGFNLRTFTDKDELTDFILDTVRRTVAAMKAEAAQGASGAASSTEA